MMVGWLEIFQAQNQAFGPIFVWNGVQQMIMGRYLPVRGEERPVNQQKIGEI
jgi:hypothetical protein